MSDEQAREDEERREHNAMMAAHCAAKAWSVIKPAGDPDWNALPMEIRHKLLGLADRYLAGYSEKEGDYAPAGFRNRVLHGDEIDAATERAANGLGYTRVDGHIERLPPRDEFEASMRGQVQGAPLGSPEAKGLAALLGDDRVLVGHDRVDLASGDPIRLVHGDGVDIRPDPLPDSPLKGTITVEKDEGGTSATVNVEAPATQSPKATKTVKKK